ncbi:MAG: flavin reductase family protein [Qingshengfaniella sp.]
MRSFKPGPDSLRGLRDALGRYATGVTVVTAPGPVGITANSFASVSLDPPLVLWAVDKTSDRQAAFRTERHSAIHVLRADQAALARSFARDGHAFEGLDWHLDRKGVPIIEPCLARFECALVADHDAGDHHILISAVEQVTVHDGQPLIFHAGRFGTFQTAG